MSSPIKINSRTAVENSIDSAKDTHNKGTGSESSSLASSDIPQSKSYLSSERSSNSIIEHEKEPKNILHKGQKPSEETEEDARENIRLRAQLKRKKVSQTPMNKKPKCLDTLKFKPARKIQIIEPHPMSTKPSLMRIPKITDEEKRLAEISLPFG